MTGAIAVIPARGGSKRIPRKNVVVLGGKPMIAWTIEAALRSGQFDSVVVSTDDDEIAAVARSHGAEVPFKRQTHADDMSPVSLATIDAVQRMTAAGQRFDVVAQLMPNCPLRTAEHVHDAMQAFRGGRASAQISGFRFGWMNPWWAVTLDAESRPQPRFPEALTARSQDLPPLYCPTGAIWVARVDALVSNQTFYTPDLRYWIMPWQAAVDIDDHEDLLMAEALLAMAR